MENSLTQTPGDEGERSPFEDAELYDLLFSNFDFGRDFYLGLAREARGPVLDVGCGTGRILLPCLQVGVNIEGLDLYPAMLEVLRRKAAALGFKPRVYTADMRDFTLPHRYALIMIAFNAFLHNLTTEDQLKTLRVCREHLGPGGTLVFDVFFPGLEVLSGPQGTPVLELEVLHPQTGLPVRLFDTRSFDRVEQIQRSQVEIQELDSEGRVTASHRSKTTVRWIFKPEMELLLEAAGFSNWQICGGFDRRPLTRETDLIVVFARKA